MKNINTYWILFLVGFCVWLAAVLFVRMDNAYFVQTSSYEPINDTAFIHKLQYALLSNGVKVKKSQLLGYSKSRAEVEGMITLNEGLKNFSDANDLKQRFKNNSIKDYEINELLTSLMKLDGTQAHSKPKLRKEKISRRIPTNKDEKVRLAEKALHQAQQAYAQRKISISELKNASDNLADARSMPENREVITTITQKLPANATWRKLDKETQQLLLSKILERIRAWFASAEVTAEVSGIFYTNQSGKAFIVQKHTQGTLQFFDTSLRAETVAVNILCDGGEELSGTARRSLEPGYYKISLNDSSAASCINSVDSKVVIKVYPEKSTLFTRLMNTVKSDKNSTKAKAPAH